MFGGVEVKWLSVEMKKEKAEDGAQNRINLFVVSAVAGFSGNVLADDVMFGGLDGRVETYVCKFRILCSSSFHRDQLRTVVDI